MAEPEATSPKNKARPPDRPKLSVLDLFSGIGGFSLGLERTGGFKTSAFCEIDGFARSILRRHWPAVPIFDDVVKLRGRDVGPIDVVCGGFPCQDISYAGHGAGLGGKRSGLWSEIARLVGELRPRYVVVENVSALLVRGLDAVLGDLAALGYDAEWHCIGAGNIGLPHGRDRIWIVAYPAGERTDRLVTREQIRSAALDIQNGWAGWADQIYLFPSVDRMVANTDGRIERNDHGLPEGLDRLKAVGNAIVPQIAEVIGRGMIKMAAL